MSIRMLLFHDIEETEYFWADFIFGNSRSVPDVLDTFHRVLADEGMSFKFYKGNDTQLNYTLLDWESGARWMTDLYESVRSSKGKSPRRHEYVIAAYRSIFVLPDYAAGSAGGGIEADELLMMLQYNGKWVFRKETFSIVLFFCKKGVLGSGDLESQRSNFRRAVDLCRSAWNRSSPLFCWMDVAPHLYCEAVEQISKGRAPTGAWLSLSSPSVYTPEILKSMDTNPNLVCDRMENGTIFVENAKCRRGKLRYF
jgi:hypothetical protein